VAEEPKRKPFVYRPRSAASRERLLAELQWDEVIYQADRGKAAELCAYLRSDLPLDVEKREALAGLIERRIDRRKGKHGPKPGVIPAPHPHAPDVTQREVVALTRKMLQEWRAHHGGKTQWGGNEAALEFVCERLREQSRTYRFDRDAVLRELRRRPNAPK
jgi:hypothetical protein